MADITKCLDAHECKFKYFCYRYNAHDGIRQSWGNMKDMSNSGKTCQNQIKDKCPYCQQTKVHKMGCLTRKITNYEMDK